MEIGALSERILAARRNDDVVRFLTRLYPDMHQTGICTIRVRAYLSICYP